MDGSLTNIPEKTEDIVRTAKEEFERAWDAVEENYREAAEDQEFVFAEDQWDEADKTARAGRPCLTINDLPTFLDQVTGEQRKAIPAIKVSPVDSNADIKTAEVIGGLVRAIEQKSSSDIAYSTALESSTSAGFGHIRVITQYIDKKTFNQEILINPVEDFQSVIYDPDAKKWNRSDGRYLFIYEDMPVKDFKAAYPNAELTDFGEGVSDTWAKNDHIKIAEYFRKEFTVSKLYELTDGRIVSEVPEGMESINERDVEDYKIVWRKISGNEVLEGPITLKGKYFPVSPCRGKESVVNGVRKARGMFRYVKDTQKMYNYFRSSETEFVAMAPKTPYVGTAKMFAGFEAKWKEANNVNSAYLPFNADPEMPSQRPQREPPPQIPAGLVHQSATLQGEKKDVIGLYNASLGKTSNETSGKAIQSRKQQDDSKTYIFIDNLSRCIEHVFRIIVDLIPHVYDTARVIEILGIDGSTVKQEVNTPGGISLTIGEYDVTVSVGPGYQTQRQETKDSLIQMMQYAPNVSAYLVDVVAELMDAPGMEKIVKRLQFSLPPQVQQAEAMEKQGQDGKIPIQIAQQMIQQGVQQEIQKFMESVEAKEAQSKVMVQDLRVKQEQVRLEEEEVRLKEEQVKLNTALIKQDGVEAEVKEKIKGTVAKMVMDGDL